MSEKDAKKELMRRANDLSPTVRVGKDGLDQGLFDEIAAQLKKNRLIKAKGLSNSDGDAKDAAAAKKSEQYNYAANPKSRNKNVKKGAKR